MRITIDTDLQAIIVPDSYYTQVDKLNEIIIEAGGKPLDYRDYIRTCFEKAYAKQIISQGDLMKLRNSKKRKSAAKTDSLSDENSNEH